MRVAGVVYRAGQPGAVPRPLDLKICIQHVGAGLREQHRQQRQRRWQRQQRVAMRDEQRQGDGNRRGDQHQRLGAGQRAPGGPARNRRGRWAGADRRMKGFLRWNVGHGRLWNAAQICRCSVLHRLSPTREEARTAWKRLRG